jgi:long-subunit fatty acid transport protein
VPLDWKDRFVFRFGVEYAVIEEVRLRAGYTHGASPAASSTLTPLTGAIMEHTITAGVGHQRGPLRVDLAYQYSLPSSESVGTSGLLAGEHDASRVEVELHTDPGGRRRPGSPGGGGGAPLGGRAPGGVGPRRP